MIDHGLVHSTFGIAALSTPSFVQGCPQYELDSIIGQSVSGTQPPSGARSARTGGRAVFSSGPLVDEIARNTHGPPVPPGCGRVLLMSAWRHGCWP
ncbi:hypothetical protein ACFYWU_41365 [Streptomyces chrestomyceticus]|uniref:hypothetical protein n=1 Tax=Streptomyces chrestomyceticus TaxID=68185 RepID=UPI0036A13E49